MKIISLRVHGVLDYGTVAGFASLPSIFGFTGIPQILCYVLSAAHLLVTIITRFPLGIFKVLPIRLHKIVETIVGPLLVLTPWIYRFSGEVVPRNVFVATGFVIIAVGLLTDYYEEQ